ncbi:hypothetical protein HYDPIDRAFT_109033 [Hydnomerulius pinastri MD-312]|nr:hypothetical protein HYDPIDRAFT_109033 [Hydnomerulius pinastri MD-312]
MDPQTTENIDPLSSRSSSEVLSGWDTFDDSGYAEPQDSIDLRLNPSNSEELTWAKHTSRKHTFSPLPQSSPFPSDSQVTDHMILDFDTSPPGAPSLRSRQWSDDQTRHFRSESFQEANPTDSVSNEIATGGEIPVRSVELSQFYPSGFRSHTWESPARNFDNDSIFSPCPDGGAKNYPFPPINFAEPTSECAFSDRNELRSSSIDGPQSHLVQVTRNAGAPEDILRSTLPLDFLSDPDPWATIGKILKLEPLKTQPHGDVDHRVELGFTKEREGVGHISSEGSSLFRRGSDSPRGVRPSDKPNLPPPEDFWTVSEAPGSANVIKDCNVMQSSIKSTVVPVPSTPENALLRPPLLHSLSPEITPPLPPAKDDRHTDITKGPPSRPPFLSTSDNLTVEGEAAGITYDGPCLFGDSDFEEDE